MKVTRRQFKLLLERILKETYSVSDIETQPLTQAEKSKYSDVLPRGHKYKIIQKVSKGTDSPLAFDLIGGKRIGDFGEQKLKAYAKAAVSPSGIETYNHQRAEDTNAWVAATLYMSLAPSAVGGAVTGRPGGGADSVGADLWIPSMAANQGWGANATAAAGILNLTLCGVAYSMKMSAATTQSGDETVQPTKFVKHEGIADVGYLLVYKYLYESGQFSSGVDPKDLTSTSRFKEAINKKLVSMGIRTVKYNGGAANGSLAKSKEITSKIQKDSRINLSLIKDRDDNIISDATITFGNVAYLLNTLVSTDTIASGFEAAKTATAKINYLQSQFDQARFYSNYESITSKASMTYSVGSSSRSINVNGSGSKNKQFYDSFWPAAEEFLNRFTGSNINPTLAISFRSCKPVEYTLELPTKPRGRNAKQPDLQWSGGATIEATKSGLPEEDALIIFGKYADSAYPFIRSMSSVYGDLAPKSQLEDLQQDQQDYNLMAQQDHPADVDAVRIQTQLLDRESVASGFDLADSLIAMVTANKELKVSIEGIIRTVVTNLRNFSGEVKLGSPAAKIFVQYSELFGTTVGTVDPLVAHSTYLSNISIATQEYLDKILLNIRTSRARETQTRGGFFHHSSSSKNAFLDVWTAAIENIGTVTALESVQKPGGTTTNDLVIIKNKLELIKNELLKGRIVSEENAIDFVGFRENKIKNQSKQMLAQMYSIQTVLTVMNEISEYLISTMNIDITLSYNEYLNKSLQILQPLADFKSKKNTEYEDNIVSISNSRKDEPPFGQEERSAAALNTNSDDPILKQVAESKIYEVILRELMKY